MSFYVEYNPLKLNIDTGIQVARGGGSGGEISESLKEALLQLAEKVAYIDADGQEYYQALYDALYPVVASYTISNILTNVANSNTSSTISSGESYTATLSCAQNYEITSVTITMGGTDVTGTSYSGGIITIPNVTGNIVITAVATERTATLLSISAVFTQGTTVIYTTTPLNDLKQYLVVTATWSDTTTSTVAASDYTLSGTLTAGTSTVTVSYGSKTTTFTVTVTETALYPLPVITNKAVSGDFTLSVSDGNSIDITTTANSRQCYVYADGDTGNNSSGQQGGHGSFFSIPVGATYELKLKNISYTGNTEANNWFGVFLRDGSKNFIISTGSTAETATHTTIASTGDGTLSDATFTGTVSIESDTYITALYLFVSRAVTLHYDCELRINGTRYI